jgi:hypothetical protein
VWVRRCQRRLLLPIAEKVLPFRPSATPEDVLEDPSNIGDDDPPATGLDRLPLRVALAEGRIAEAFARSRRRNCATLRDGPWIA